MIEGELYVLAECPKCAFAYNAKSERTIHHYACVNKYNEVKIPGIGLSFGRLPEQSTRIANDEERSRFYEYLHESGYHYNIANKKVIRISTGEIV